MSHQTISWVKSGIRIAGYALLIPISGAFAIPAVVLILSEVLGVFEEVGY